METTHVQYGCGFSAPPEWLNFDASPTVRLQQIPLLGRMVSTRSGRFPANVRFGDVVRGLPIPPQSAKAVYCSHVLEHLALSDLRIALVNTRKTLRKQGIFRLVVPDLLSAAIRYTENRGDDAAIRFMNETVLGVPERKRGAASLLRLWLGNSQHLWMWDFPSMRRELAEAGFKNIRAAAFGDSEDPMFAFVEDKSRWQDAVAIQCYA